MHVIRMLQLLLFSGLAFFALLHLLKRTETITLDTDWFYRKGLTFVLAGLTGGILAVYRAFDTAIVKGIPARLSTFSKDPLALFSGVSGKRSGTRKKGKPSVGTIEANTSPIGVPVVFALVLLAALSFMFMKLFK